MAEEQAPASEAAGTPFVHPSGLCESNRVGPGTRVWAFAHVLPGAVIGSDCNICDHVLVENDVIVGDRVTVKSGVQLWDGVRLEDDVFVGPNATFTNDRFPRSKVPMVTLPRTRVRRGASLGANCTILPGVTIGAGAMVGAGAVVLDDVPPHTVVVGNPARSVRRTERPGGGTAMAESEPAAGRLATGGTTAVFGDDASGRLDMCRILDLPRIYDPRGNLTFVEGGEHTPFNIKRVYYLYDVPGGESRGGHAHHDLQQLIIAASGSFDVVVKSGDRERRFFLNRSYYGLYIPALLWRELENFSSGSVCLVLASLHFSEDDYYRDFPTYASVWREARG